jgi:cytochrome c-type biogenesis protein CcmF
MFIGYTGSAFNLDTTKEVKIGDRFTLGAYDLHVKQVSDGENENYVWQRADIGIYNGGAYLGDLSPERRVYKASEQPTSEVRIRRRLNEDLYLNFASMSQQTEGAAIIQAYIFPLVSWIWIGFYVLMMGTLVCLVPSKQKLAYAKTEVVGVYAREAAKTK